MLNNDWYSIEKKLSQMFSSIKIYKEGEENKLKKKLAKVSKKLYVYLFLYQFIRKNQEILDDSITKMDRDKLGYVSFMNFRKILENTNFNVKDKYIEYMIYKMKSDCSDDSALDDLRYNV